MEVDRYRCCCYLEKGIELRSNNYKAHIDLRCLQRKDSVNAEVYSLLHGNGNRIKVCRDDPSETFITAIADGGSVTSLNNGKNFHLFINRSGYVNVTGALSKFAIEDLLCELLSADIETIKKNLIVDNISFSGRIENIEHSIDLHFARRLVEILHNDFIDNPDARYYAKYNPESFPGLVLRLPNIRATFTLFASGKITAVGVKEEEECIKICKILKNIYKLYLILYDPTTGECKASQNLYSHITCCGKASYCKDFSFINDLLRQLSIPDEYERSELYERERLEFRHPGIAGGRYLSLRGMKNALRVRKQINVRNVRRPLRRSERIRKQLATIK